MDFDPGALPSENLGILERLGEMFSEGIAKHELRQILHRCTQCRRLVFVERRDCHVCQGPELRTKDPLFDFTSAMDSRSPHCGLSLEDFKALVATCKGCSRVVLSETFIFHICSALFDGTS